MSSLVPIHFGLCGSIPSTGVEAPFIIFIDTSSGRSHVSVGSLSSSGFGLPIPTDSFVVAGPIIDIVA